MNFFEKNKEGLRILSKFSFGFKESLFLVFKFGNYYAIIRVVVVLVTIVTPHVGPLMILRRLTYTTGSRNSFLIIYWYRGRVGTVYAFDVLQVLQPLEKN
jgi:hypothetical protein